MAVIMLLIIFIIGERNVNRSIPGAESIYRLKRGGETLLPMSLIDDVRQQVPGVRNICMYSIHDNLFNMGDVKTDVKCLATNDAFPDIFSYDFIYRASDNTLNTKDNVIITRSFSEKWFGNRNPLGEILKGESMDLKIVGVISDPPLNSSFRFDIIFGLDRGWANFMGSKEYNESHKLFNSFVRLEENADPEVIGRQLSKIINKWHFFSDDKVSLQPLGDVYFDTTTSGDYLPHANVSMLYLLSSIALVLLFMTIFNYVSLTVSAGYQRIKEIGIRKTTGAANHNIFFQFFNEGFLVTFVSFVLAAVLSLLIAPGLSGILGKEINIGSLFSVPQVWITVLIVFSLTGIISGLFPALAFYRFSPQRMITRNMQTGKSNPMGGIIAVQFLIAITLISSAFFIQKQIIFIKHKDLGFQKDLVIRLDLQGEAIRKSDVLKQKLLSNPDIIAVAGSSGSIMDFEGIGTHETVVEGQTKDVDWRMFGIDENFVDLFGLKIIEGKNIDYSSKEPACLINEWYYHNLGWDSFEGKKLYGCEVVGIIRDIFFDNLHQEMGFLVMEKTTIPDVLNIKINGSVPATIEFIRKSYSEIEPSTPVDFAFYDDWIQSMYQKEEKQARAVGIFASFALIIACLGLIGLIELTTNRKIKEIGIRKVNGARVSEILAMLNKNMVKWVAIAFLTATPLAYFAMSRWLEDFAYRTELSWWIFALAGILALGIALLTVSFQSWKAATRNPVEALRYE
jgi:putative ABC transport system permease protein